MISAGERDAARLIDAMRRVLAAEPLAVPDYVEIVDADSFEPVTQLRRPSFALLAVRIGATRLIDNMLIEVEDAASSPAGRWRDSLFSLEERALEEG